MQTGVREVARDAVARQTATRAVNPRNVIYSALPREADWTADSFDRDTGSSRVAELFSVTIPAEVTPSRESPFMRRSLALLLASIIVAILSFLPSAVGTFMQKPDTQILNLTPASSPIYARSPMSAKQLAFVPAFASPQNAAIFGPVPPPSPTSPTTFKNGLVIPVTGTAGGSQLPKLRGGMGSWVGCSLRLANDRRDACRCRCDYSREWLVSKLGHLFRCLCRLLHHSPYRKPFRLGVSGAYHGLPRARPVFRQLAPIIEPRPGARSCSRPCKKHGWNVPSTLGNSCGAGLHGRRTLEPIPRRARSAHTPR